MVRCNVQIQEDLVNTLLGSSEQRLARVLASLNQLGQSGEEGIGTTLSQQELANVIGVSRQRVNLLVKRLRRND